MKLIGPTFELDGKIVGVIEAGDGAVRAGVVEEEFELLGVAIDLIGASRKRSRRTNEATHHHGRFAAQIQGISNRERVEIEAASHLTRSKRVRSVSGVVDSDTSDNKPKHVAKSRHSKSI